MKNYIQVAQMFLLDNNEFIISYILMQQIATLLGKHND